MACGHDLKNKGTLGGLTQLRSSFPFDIPEHGVSQPSLDTPPSRPRMRLELRIAQQPTAALRQEPVAAWALTQLIRAVD